MNQKLDATFHALADPTRRAMLVRLGQGQHSIAELAAPFDMSLWGATKHIRVLEDAGLVNCRKQGRAQICSLNAGPLAQANRWLRQWERFWMGRLDRLEALIEKEKESGR
jgi:DNA-binding transcriptional ArsR family regulator